MTNTQQNWAHRLAILREQAEAVLGSELTDELGGHLKGAAALIYELQVHQIELEMQNEELRQVQVQLSEAKDQYSELYDFAPVGYMTIGVNGLIEQANLTSALLLGVARADLVKQPLSNFVFTADQDLLYQHRRQLFTEPQALHRVELRFIHAATTPFYAQLESQVISRLPGQITGYRTILSDITARKQQEAALLASHQQLTLTLAKLHTTQATLLQRERLAAVGQLAAGIAHDFNNILTVISNYTALLLHDTTLGTRALSRLLIIKEQAEHAAKLVQQILDFSRQSTAEHSPLDLYPFLVDVTSMLTRTLRYDLALTLHPYAGSCYINANPTQLQQVFINLINNAKAVLPDGGAVSLAVVDLDLTAAESTASSVVSPGSWAKIIVADNGPGIAPEVLPHIFEPFFTTHAPQGSGLGLAQVQGIIKQHGGEIEVVTQLGQGTSFILYLPRLAPTVQPRPSPTFPAPEKTATIPLQPTGNRETLLLVDDNEMVVNMLAELLGVMGYQIVTAPDGGTALKRYQQHRHEIALVITDLTMPQMNGIELTNALRALDPQVKVMIVTGYQPDATTKKQLQGGEVRWLQKPIDINLLLQALTELIETR